MELRLKVGEFDFRGKGKARDVLYALEEAWRIRKSPAPIARAAPVPDPLVDPISAVDVVKAIDGPHDDGPNEIENGPSTRTMQSGPPVDPVLADQLDGLVDDDERPGAQILNDADDMIAAREHDPERERRERTAPRRGGGEVVMEYRNAYDLWFVEPSQPMTDAQGRVLERLRQYAVPDEAGERAVFSKTVMWLAKEFEMSGAGMSQHVSRLVDQGLISRSGRKVIVL